jgi:hypothetical protein
MCMYIRWCLEGRYEEYHSTKQHNFSIISTIAATSFSHTHHRLQPTPLPPLPNTNYSHIPTRMSSQSQCDDFHYLAPMIRKSYPKMSSSSNTTSTVLPRYSTTAPPPYTASDAYSVASRKSTSKSILEKVFNRKCKAIQHLTVLKCILLILR